MSESMVFDPLTQIFWGMAIAVVFTATLLYCVRMVKVKEDIHKKEKGA